MTDTLKKMLHEACEREVSAMAYMRRAGFDDEAIKLHVSEVRKALTARIEELGCADEFNRWLRN